MSPSSTNKRGSRAPQQNNELETAKPKHPLNPYTVYFQVEHKRILSGTDHLSIDLVTREQVRAIIELNQVKPKRIHRKTQGKIGFRELARTIGRRWKSLGPKSRRVFEDASTIERMRYYEELKRNRPATEDQEGTPNRQEEQGAEIGESRGSCFFRPLPLDMVHGPCGSSSARQTEGEVYGNYFYPTAQENAGSAVLPCGGGSKNPLSHQERGNEQSEISPVLQLQPPRTVTEAFRPENKGQFRFDYRMGRSSAVENWSHSCDMDSSNMQKTKKKLMNFVPPEHLLTRSSAELVKEELLQPLTAKEMDTLFL